MSNFVMLWQKTLDSSVWRRESQSTRIVWLTLLMMKDSEGMVYSSEVGLTDRARVSPEECREALRIFTSPDPNDSSGVEEGRKIKKIQGGWQIVNHDMYRFSTEAKREFWRKTKAEQRAREKQIMEDSEAARKREFKKRRRDCTRDAQIIGVRSALAQGKKEQDQSLARASV